MRLAILYSRDLLDSESIFFHYTVETNKTHVTNVSNVYDLIYFIVAHNFLIACLLFLTQNSTDIGGVSLRDASRKYARVTVCFKIDYRSQMTLVVSDLALPGEGRKAT